MNSDVPMYQDFTYDPVGRLVGHNDYVSTSFTLAYDANGNRSQYNGYNASALIYNTATSSNRLNNISQNGAVKKAYSYDANGNLTNDGKNTYTYDGRGRLVQASGTGYATEYYRINGLGQRTAKVTGTAPDMAGDINQDGLISSANAALLSQAISAGTAANNAINDCNHSGSVTIADVTCINTKIAAIAANPSQYIQTGTYFAYDEAGHLLGEYTQTGSPIQETIWLGDIPVAVMAGANNYYIYTDHLNSPRAIADSTGKTVWRWQDASFGTSAANPDPDGDGVQFTYNLRYPGQYYDASTGLHYNWNRSYDPNTGRYLESDPIGLEGGLNTYGYVNGNPVNWVDPTGKFIGVLSRIGLTAIGNALVDAATIRFGGAMLADGLASEPAPYSHADEREARDLTPNPFGDNCEQMKEAIKILKGQIAWRYSDLNPRSATYAAHLRHIKMLEETLKKLEVAYKNICGNECPL